MFIKLTRWAMENFDKNSIPTIDTLQRLCREGKINGATKLGKKWYIKVDTKNRETKNEQR